MGSTSKILTLLSAPFPLLYQRRSSTHFLRIARHAFSHRISHSTPRPIRPNSQLKSHLHSQSKAHLDPASIPFLRKSALVTQILKLVEGLDGKGHFGNVKTLMEDEFVTDEGIGDEFLKAAEVCFTIAKDRPDALRSLSRKDLEVIVNNGSPSLFKNGTSSASRMEMFLSGDESKVLESERAQTVDIMRYMLSYAHDSLNNTEGINKNGAELVEMSITNVITQLVTTSGTVAIPSQAPVNYEQASRAPMQNIEMKRGDWICGKCSFMNFARNSRCLECDEARPKRQLTGAEWECPQCDYYNHGRNVSCIRCDCKRPGEIPSTTPYPSISTLDQILNRNNPGKFDLEQKLAANDEKGERWFNKISQLGDNDDKSNSMPDEDFPEIMPLRKGVNRFVTSTRKTPLERRLANSQTEVSKPSESSINKSLDRILGRSTSASQSESEDYRQSIAKSDPNYVPFVPLPPDMFKKPQNSNKEADVPSEPTSNTNESFENNAASPDDDFPEIMPMRKGENRFVVSKKKDRSLTSPQYKRRIAMEQANKSDFIPFVPFPPDYFAKKDKQPEGISTNMSTNKASENAQASSNKLENNLNESWNSNASNASNSTATSWDSTQDVGTYQNMPQNTQTNSNGSSDMGDYNKSYDYNSYNSTIDSNREVQNNQSMSRNIQPRSSSPRSAYGSTQGGQYQSTSKNNQTASNSTSSTYGSTLEVGKYQTASQNMSQNVKSSYSYSGKSLEGSAVTEPDPLDMSEEAKAARWFRRAAQIKNISELSEIPDEDFPEIMPMRKGVNRFVVSKRKTPLERRLTSPQYRRNLPIVSSEPEKDSS